MHKFNLDGKYSQCGDGIIFGLSLILFVNQRDRLSFLGYSYGNDLLMSIHPQNTLLFPTLDSLLIHTGRNIRVSIKKLETTRLRHPYESNCSYGHDTEAVFPGPYTTHICQVLVPGDR